PRPSPSSRRSLPACDSRAAEANGLEEGDQALRSLRKQAADQGCRGEARSVLEEGDLASPQAEGRAGGAAARRRRGLGARAARARGRSGSGTTAGTRASGGHPPSRSGLGASAAPEREEAVA